MESLKAYECRNCGHAMFPRRARCSKCRMRNFTEFELKEGRLLTFTTLQITGPGVSKPLFLGIAMFEKDVCALAQLVPGEIRTGMKVRPIFGKLREKNAKSYMGFRFEKV
ncbi:MAG: Zn-ribbon domain-containing OB-fold protein [Candidatus Bathyarchaeia archaeon]